MVAVVVIVVLLGGTFAAISGDWSNLGATGSETLTPSGASVGEALVVYSPGFSGAAKDAAAIIANDLQERGYTVDLAGVRSEKAADKSGYNIIVAGGAMYWGQVSSSIDGYLKTLPSGVKIGAFGTTGSSEYQESDFDSFKQQVVSNTNNENAVVKLILAGTETADCADLVSKLTQ